MRKNLAFLLCLPLVLNFFGCTKKNNQKIEQQTQLSQAAHSSQAPNQKEKENVRICSSVKTVKDEYIPLLNTNVFIKTDGTEQGEILADKIENEIKKYHKIFDQFHYYYDDESSGIVKNLALLNEHINQKKAFSGEALLSEILNESLNIMDLTDGKFNIFINPVLNLYDGLFSPFPVVRQDPESSAINAALKKILDVQKAKRVFTCGGTEIKFDFSDSVF